jgi:protein-disulfide isomerase
MKRYLPLVIIGGVLVVVIVGALILIRSKRTETAAPFAPQVAAIQTPAPSLTESPKSETPENKIPVIPANVSVTVEEYGDYQCPPCGILHPEIKKIEHEYGPRINFVFRNLPLTVLHKNALAAAQAAEAARLQSRFTEMHDRIYESQNAWKDEANPRPIFTKYAGELGLDIDRFSRDMDGNEVQLRLAEDQRRAKSLGVEGTPTVFVEGRQLKFEATTGEGIRKAINLMLTRKVAAQ